MAQKEKQQALTNNSAQQAFQALENKTETSSEEIRTQRTPSLNVNVGPPTSGRIKRSQKGGHGYTMELSRDEVRYICHVGKILFDQQMPVYFGTIRCPDGLSVNNQKRYLSRKVGHIGQSIKRKGESFFCISLYERTRGRSKLHLHLLIVATSPKARFVIRRYSNGDSIEFKKANPNIIHYLVKQRQSTKPDYIRSKRQPGDLIPGPRYSLTADLKKLVSPHIQKPTRRKTPRNAARDASLKLIP
jgi:hypothetical protein